MPAATFDVTIVNGELQPKGVLRAFEGQQLRISVDIVPTAEKRAEAPEQPPFDEPPEGMDVEKDVYVNMPFQSEAIEGAVILEGGPLSPMSAEEMDVEKEIYVKMPRKVEILKDVKIVDRGRRRPRVILPEELPDD